MSLKKDFNRKIVVLITEAPYSKPLLIERLRYLENIARNCEYLVLFFYLDGIHQLHGGQSPKNFIDIESYWDNFAQKFENVEFMACSRCAGARGYIDFSQSDTEKNIYRAKDLLDFIKIVSILKLGKLVQKGYRL